MKISEFYIKDVKKTVPEETVSKILPVMKKNKIHQMPVEKNGKFAGMVFLKDIVMEDIDPSITKVENLMKKNVPVLKPAESEKKAAQTILQNGVRAAAVVEGNSIIGIVSETDLLRFVSNHINAGSIMTEPVCVAEGDPIGKVKKILATENVSRLPVTDGKGKLTGVIDTLDLINYIKPRERQNVLREGYGERISLSEFPIGSFMRAPVCVTSDSPLKNVVEGLEMAEEVIVTDSGKPVGIITPKDVIELLVSEKKDNIIQIMNVEKDDEITKTTIYNEIERWVEKPGSNIDFVFVYVHMHKSRGGRIKYSLRVRVRTKIGFFVLSASGWNLLMAAQEIARKGERIVKKNYEKIRDVKRKRE